MDLSTLLDGVPVMKLYHAEFGHMVQSQEIQVRRVQYDSRKVTHGDLFVAMRGSHLDGHRFIQEAISAGAGAVVLEDEESMPDSLSLHTHVAKVLVGNSRRALAQLSNNYFGHPSAKLRLIGVTGTNGKSTTTHLIKAILDMSGDRTGLIGTIEYRLGTQVEPAVHTTPESLELNEYLGRMVENGCRSAVMEVSSHALHQERVYGFRFDAAVFTNLTQDHLDYHGTMDEYFRAKRILFEGLSENAIAVYNNDDPYGERIVQNTRARKIAFGMQTADVVVTSTILSESGIKLRLRHREREFGIESPLVGAFNVENIAAAVAVGIGLGISPDSLQEGIRKVTSVRGRFERVISPAGWTAIVDYAHTPDALKRCLLAVRSLRETAAPDRRGKIITVFGCGGNRDRGKRPTMGRIATELSDITVVTSDNPRLEDPESIIDEVLVGAVRGRTVHRESDRTKAVRNALGWARVGDYVLLAGKGHETDQILKDRRIHLDDREIVENFIEEQRASAHRSPKGSAT